MEPDYVFMAQRQLSLLRSMAVVGRALAEKYPDADAFGAMLQDPATVAVFRATGEIGLAASNAVYEASPETDEELTAITKPYYDRVAEVIGPLAASFGVSVADLQAAII